jgi:hypothetical protein
LVPGLGLRQTSLAYVQGHELITTTGGLLSGRERELAGPEGSANTSRHLQNVSFGSFG